ncbi:MAG: hypothetical protein ABJQ34_17660 [Paracoccaceae bacterium]
MSDPAVTQMANEMAEECIQVQVEIGNDRLFMELGQVLGSSSQTLEEAFLTAVRTRMANAAGKKFLERALKAHRDQAGKNDPA